MSTTTESCDRFKAAPKTFEFITYSLFDDCIIESNYIKPVKACLALLVYIHVTWSHINVRNIVTSDFSNGQLQNKTY